MPDTLTAPRVWNKRTHHLPAGAVYVGRPTKWGNPFEIGKHGDRAEVIRRYIEWINEHEDGWAIAEAARRELKGKHLACWCAPEPCHADVLMEIANG